MSIGINCDVSFFLSFFQLLLVPLCMPASSTLYFFIRTIYRLKSVVYVKLLNPARINVNLREVKLLLSCAPLGIEPIKNHRVGHEVSLKLTFDSLLT